MMPPNLLLFSRIFHYCLHLFKGLLFIWIFDKSCRLSRILNIITVYSLMVLLNVSHSYSGAHPLQLLWNFNRKETRPNIAESRGVEPGWVDTSGEVPLLCKMHTSILSKYHLYSTFQTQMSQCGSQEGEPDKTHSNAEYKKIIILY